MIKNLMDLWRGKDFLTVVLGSFEKMLNNAEALFVYAGDELIEDKKGKVTKSELYRVDKEINKLERSIRKRIVEHLSIQPGIDVAACLVLMSVVKDAERLGDYAKNLYEVSEMLKRPFPRKKFDNDFKGLDSRIRALFEKARKAFIDSDEELARELMSEEREIVKCCDDLVLHFAQSKLDANEAVCSTLIARYFKRIAAHLGNITSSVVMPVSDLDYFDEKL